MPELHFSIGWPDGTTEICYSPSTIVRDHFTPDTLYPLPEFLARSRAALTAASERVRQRYGAPCSLALGQLARIEATAASCDATANILFKSFEE
jgi:uncharacterized repeat protein (TIGR04042 family)